MPYRNMAQSSIVSQINSATDCPLQSMLQKKCESGVYLSSIMLIISLNQIYAVTVMQ